MHDLPHLTENVCLLLFLSSPLPLSAQTYIFHCLLIPQVVQTQHQNCLLLPPLHSSPQTVRPQTHSLALSFLSSPPSTQTVILESSLPLPAHLNDPLSNSWTKLSSLTLRVQPQSNLPPLLSTLIHLPLNPASSPSSIRNTIRPSDSYLTPHSHSCQNKSDFFKILQIMKQ